MTQFIVEVDAQAEQLQEEARKGGGDGKFPPVPAGKYQAFVEKIEGVENFGGTGANSQKKVLKLRVKIVAESPVAAGRVYFVKIPLFMRWAPNDKNPQGAVASTYFDFFEKVMQIPSEQVAKGQVGDLEAVGGKPLTVILSKPKAPDQWNPLGSNEVSFVNAPGDIKETPQTKLMVPWLDDNGNLNPQFAQGAPGQGAAPQQTAPPAYGAPQAAPPAYGAQSAVPPAYGAQQPVAQQAPPAYGAPAQAAPGWMPGQDAVQVAAAAATGY